MPAPTATPLTFVITGCWSCASASTVSPMLRMWCSACSRSALSAVPRGRRPRERVTGPGDDDDTVLRAFGDRAEHLAELVEHHGGSCCGRGLSRVTVTTPRSSRVTRSDSSSCISGLSWRARGSRGSAWAWPPAGRPRRTAPRPRRRAPRWTADDHRAGPLQPDVEMATALERGACNGRGEQVAAGHRVEPREVAPLRWSSSRGRRRARAPSAAGRGYAGAAGHVAVDAPEVELHERARRETPEAPVREHVGRKPGLEDREPQRGRVAVRLLDRPAHLLVGVDEECCAVGSG